MDWTKDRIESLSKAEVRQLRANAEQLNEPEIVAWCDEVLRKARASKAPKGSVRAAPEK
ncbi:MAG: hypothetical protein M0015_12810 [Betaproteobacteria bacterium]|nr:hypothetical protein [Betaproteobacteria bacterium]